MDSKEQALEKALKFAGLVVNSSADTRILDCKCEYTVNYGGDLEEISRFPYAQPRVAPQLGTIVEVWNEYESDAYILRSMGKLTESGRLIVSQHPRISNGSYKNWRVLATDGEIVSLFGLCNKCTNRMPAVCSGCQTTVPTNYERTND
jgi:hypothetical protein